MSYRRGNFSRGYSIMDFLLEDSSRTLAEAAEEFRIHPRTARADINRAALDAIDRLCYNPENVLRMYDATQKQLKKNSKHGSKGKKTS